MIESSTLLIAAGIAAVSSFGAPVLAQVLMNRQRQRERTEDREAMAKEVKVVWNILVESTKATTNTLQKLEQGQGVIHALVNSNMSAAMKAELDASIRDLASLRELLDLKKAQGRPPTPEAMAAIHSAEIQVTELTAALKDRDKQTAGK